MSSKSQAKPGAEQSPGRSGIERRRAAKAEEIMRVAAAIMVRKGYAGTTTDDICDALGVTKPTLYHYFRGKEELVASICRAGVEATMRVFDPEQPEDMPTRDWLEQRLRELNRLTIRHLPGTVLTMRDSHYLSVETRAWMAVGARDFFRKFEAILERGRQEGVFTFHNVHVAAHMMSGVVGYLYTWYKDDGPVGAEEIIEQLTAAMLSIIDTRLPVQVKG